MGSTLYTEAEFKSDGTVKNVPSLVYKKSIHKFSFDFYGHKTLFLINSNSLLIEFFLFVCYLFHKIERQIQYSNGSNAPNITINQIILQFWSRKKNPFKIKINNKIFYFF